MLWMSHEARDLCPLRHLMVHLHCIQWKGGSIFPTFEELNNPPADGICVTKMTEDDLCKTTEPICEDVLKRKERLGSHTCRKTGCLLAVLMGCLDCAVLMLDANHACPRTATKCIQDAMCIAKIIKCFMDPNQFIGTQWSSCHTCGGEGAAAANSPGAKWQKPLAELVPGFIEKVVGVSPLDPRCREPQHLSERVVAWKKPDNNPNRALQGHLALVSQDKTHEILNCVSQMRQDAADTARKQERAEQQRRQLAQMSNLVLHLKQQMADSGVDEATAASILKRATESANVVVAAGGSVTLTIPSNSTAEPAAKRAKVTKDRGDKVLPEAPFNMSRAPAAQKLQWIDEHANTNQNIYVEKSRAMLKRINPVAKCCRLCCNSNIDTFLSKHQNAKGNFNVSGFKCVDCKDSKMPAKASSNSQI